LPEVTLGYIPSAGGTQTIGRHLPQSDAMQMVTTGEPIDAQRAYDRGLVQRLAPPGEAMTVARGLARELAAMNPEAVRAVKRAVLDGLDVSLSEGLAMERRLADRVTAQR
jgi:enoyl-CoA hydratase/carnithine racemase